MTLKTGRPGSVLRSRITLRNTSYAISNFVVFIIAPQQTRAQVSLHLRNSHEYSGTIESPDIELATR